MIPNRVQWFLTNRIRGARVRRALRILAKPHHTQAKPWHGAAELIVSLTSYPPRYGTLHLTIESLLRQTVKPNRLILWVARDDEVSLPDSVLEQTGRGLEIRICDDHRSYTKLLPTLRDFPDAYVVTCDDDIYYRPEWLARLVADQPCNPDAIIAHRAHIAHFYPDGSMKPYKEWQHCTSKRTESSVLKAMFPTGVGGVLYPPGSLAPFVCDYNLAKRLAPTADDVWFFWAAGKAGTTAVKTSYRFPLIHWPGSQDVGLHVTNTIADGNDRQIRAMQAHFGLPMGSGV